MRHRLPLIVFVLLAILVVMMLGFACACLTADPMQTVERAFSFVPALGPPIETWPTLFAALATALLLVAHGPPSGSRASPALLQRFRF